MSSAGTQPVAIEPDSAGSKGSVESSTEEERVDPGLTGSPGAPPKCETGQAAARKGCEDEAHAQQQFTATGGRRRRRTNSRLYHNGNGTGHPVTGAGAQANGGGSKTLDIAVVLPGRPRARTLSSSCSYNGKPNAAAAATGTTANGNGKSSPPQPHSPHQRNAQRTYSTGPSFFDDPQVQQSGSIFIERQDMSAFYRALPRWKVNGYHIKMEDDCPQGNDDTRIFVLANLGKQNRRAMCCVLCAKHIPVYSKYPLIDGTFFVSPLNHRQFGTSIKFDGQPAFLHAMCATCCEYASPHVQCTKCGRAGILPHGTLLLGSVYSYDILSSGQCCLPCCSQCAHYVTTQSSHFSTHTEQHTCTHCGARDYHFLRRIQHLRWKPPNVDEPSNALLPALVMSQ